MGKANLINEWKKLEDQRRALRDEQHKIELEMKALCPVKIGQEMTNAYYGYGSERKDGICDEITVHPNYKTDDISFEVRGRAYKKEGGLSQREIRKYYTIGYVRDTDPDTGELLNVWTKIVKISP